MSQFSLKMPAAALTLIFSLHTANAQVFETFPDSSLTNGQTKVESQALKNVRDCLSANGTSRAVRACTKSIRAAAPSPEIRGELYARRGLSQLSMGRFEKAASDFQTAGRLDDDNMLAWLGDGFAAMMQNDHDSAMARFSDCAGDPRLSALSAYGEGLSYEMRRQSQDAREAYRQALLERPGWDAVEERLSEL